MRLGPGSPKLSNGHLKEHGSMDKGCLLGVGLGAVRWGDLSLSWLQDWEGETGSHCEEGELVVFLWRLLHTPLPSPRSAGVPFST